MAEHVMPDPRGIAAPRMLTMGVGSSGTKAVAAMARMNPAFHSAALDTDTKVLERIDMERIIHVGRAVTNGFSAGGDVELGRQAIDRDSTGLRTQLRGVDLLVIIGGLGGGTGSGGIPVVARIAREAGSLVLCLLTTPFAFEGKEAMRKSEESLKRLRTHADAIVKIPNELLLTRAETDLSAEQAFARSQEVLRDGCFALDRMLSQSGIYGLDFASIQTMLRNCDGYCHFASAEASGNDRSTIVSAAIGKHPLLGGGKMLERCSGVIIAITGGHDLRLSEIETVMNSIHSKVPAETWISYGVALDAAYEKRIGVLTLVAEQWKEPLMADSQTGLVFYGKGQGGQGKLPLEAVGKGRFTEMDPTIHNNQDLDVPTYLRQNIKLPK